MKHIFAMLALSPLIAAATTLSWEPPTSRQDGTPMDPVTELKGYQLHCGGVVTTLPATGVRSSSYRIVKHEALPGYGTTPCYLVAVDTEGRKSPKSNSVEVTWEATAPAKPISLIILE